MKTFQIPPAFHHRPQNISRKEIFIAILLALGVCLTELHSFVLAAFPNTYDMTADYFLSPVFKLNLRLLWYIKMNSDDLLKLLLFTILIITTKSKFLFRVYWIYFAYFIIDSFLFLWNFKETAETYWVLLAASIAIIILLVIFGKPKLAKWQT